MPTKSRAASENERLSEESAGLDKLKAIFWNVYPSLIIPNDGKKIADSIRLSSIDGKEYLLKDLVNGKDRLVLRYSSFDCNVCVDSVISIVQKVTRKTKLDDLIIIADFQNDRDFLIKHEYKKHPYPVYNIKQSRLGVSIENKNLPFLFILTKDMKTTKYFIPFKEVPSQTNEYVTYAFNFLEQGD